MRFSCVRSTCWETVPVDIYCLPVVVCLYKPRERLWWRFRWFLRAGQIHLADKYKVSPPPRCVCMCLPFDTKWQHSFTFGGNQLHLQTDPLQALCFCCSCCCRCSSSCDFAFIGTLIFFFCVVVPDISCLVSGNDAPSLPLSAQLLCGRSCK